VTSNSLSPTACKGSGGGSHRDATPYRFSASRNIPTSTRTKRSVLLAVDQQFGERAALRVAELSDPVGGHVLDPKESLFRSEDGQPQLLFLGATRIEQARPASTSR
jgi:hypothetical protein